MSNDQADSAQGWQSFTPIPVSLRKGYRTEVCCPRTSLKEAEMVNSKRGFSQRNVLTLMLTPRRPFPKCSLWHQILLISALYYVQRKHSPFTVSGGEEEWSQWVGRRQRSQGPGLSPFLGPANPVLESSLSTVWSAVPRPRDGPLASHLPCPSRACVLTVATFLLLGELWGQLM